MKRFLLAPDSFKGTLSAREVCEIEREALLHLVPDAQVISVPMADGGEGLVDTYLSIAGGKRISASVTGPLGEPVNAVYGLLPDGSAVMEMAAAAGLPMVLGRENPLRATTYGVGELLLHASRQGVSKVILGLGGSCTNDCGIGMAAALGYRFVDAQGAVVAPLAEHLGEIETILPPETPLPLTVEAACDVTNPLLGAQGATRVFAPQKGADEGMVSRLEAGMTHFERVLAQWSGVSAARLPGAGAAGGMGAAVRLLLHGTLRPGIDLLLDSANFDALVKNADLVLTGEGRIDSQSAHGKVPCGVGMRCKAVGVPCIALCGSIGDGAEAVYECGITAVYSAIRRPAAFEDLRATCREDLSALTESVLRTLLCREQIHTS